LSEIKIQEGKGDRKCESEGVHREETERYYKSIKSDISD